MTQRKLKLIEDDEDKPSYRTPKAWVKKLDEYGGGTRSERPSDPASH